MPAPELVQLSCTWRWPGVRVRVGIVGGAQAAKQVEAAGSPGQAMPCRERAAKSAQECGVPFARLPSSSSAARSTRQRVPAAQPSEVQVAVLVLQVKALPAVARERYQSRSTIDQAA